APAAAATATRSIRPGTATGARHHWPGRTCQGPRSAKLARRAPGPAPEGAVKGTGVTEAETLGHSHRRQAPIPQKTDREIAAGGVLDALVGGALLFQASPQGARRHAEQLGELVETGQRA